MLPEFDEEFASPADYAKYYRSIGMQVVPAYTHKETKNWKRPHLENWKQFTHELSTQEQFDEWYGKTGRYSARSNMGLITGVHPRRIVVVDLDTHKNPRAQIWWDGVHAEHNAGVMSECPTQRTGGGGFQMFFLSPEGWSCPTCKNSELGVDIRGVGGFAMLPPSNHESGKTYGWVEDKEPWTIEIEEMPKWMCDEIDMLGTAAVDAITGQRIKTPTPEFTTNEWGKITDGREERMYKMVFRAVLDLYRECPFVSKEEEEKAKIHCFNSYVDEVETRLKELGTPKHVLLEREGRGKTLFDQKWRSTMRGWDTKISEEAQKPWIPPAHETFQPVYAKIIRPEEFNGEKPSQPQEPPEGLFRVFRKSDLKALPPAEFIIEGLLQRYGSNYITGWPGCGKSFYTIGSCIAIATGQERFLGRKVNVHGPIVYVTTEGLHDHYTRMKAYEMYHDVDVDEERYLVIPDAMNLLENGDRMRLLKTIDWNISRMKEPPVYVVFDTLSRVIPGADENNQKEMSLFVKSENEVQHAFNTTTGLVHHLSRSGAGNMRGSTVLEGSADTCVVLERDKGESIGIIRAAKMKSAPDGWEMEFRLEDVEVEPLKSTLAITEAPKKAPDAGFGGKQETGLVYAAGVKMTEEERDQILNAANDAWNKQEPWSISTNQKFTERHIKVALTKILKRRIKDDKHAILFAQDFVERGWWGVQTRNKDTKLKGLQISEMFRNGTQFLRKPPGSPTGSFRENVEQNQ